MPRVSGSWDLFRVGMCPLSVLPSLERLGLCFFFSFGRVWFLRSVVCGCF